MEDRNGQETTSTRLLWIAAGLITFAAVVFGVIVLRIFGTWKDSADFGNTFGALETYFSGLAFAGLIYTIFLQRQELRLQRQELAMTRKELEGQKEELSTQNRVLKRQQVEATFFQMLGLYREALSQTGNLVYKLRRGYVEGKLFTEIPDHKYVSGEEYFSY